MIEDVLIDEVMDYFLNETYDSISEIKQLGVDILKRIAADNLEWAEKDGSIKYLFGTYINAVDSSKYNVIKDFIDHTNIAVTINEKGPKTPLGNYSTYDKGPYRPGEEREINLYADLNDLINTINTSIGEYHNFDATDLYMKLYYPFYSTLIHELQHAFDDYRSKGHALRTKQARAYNTNYNTTNRENLPNDEKRAMSYINQPHEIWARFTQALEKIHFNTFDMNNEGKIVYRMYPIKDVVDDFKVSFQYYPQLPEKIKKKLIQRVVQYWHREKEKVDEKNKNPW